MITLARHILAQSGFTAPIPDFVPDELSLTIPSAYENLDQISIDIQFQNRIEIPGTPDPAHPNDPVPPTYEYHDATLVSSPFQFESVGLTLTILSPSTVRIEGELIDVLPGEYYEFKMADYSIEQLPADTSESYFSLIHYSMPPIKGTLIIPFHAEFLEGNIDFDMSQTVYWSYAVARQNVLSAVSRSLK